MMKRNFQNILGRVRKILSVVGVLSVVFYGP